MGKTEPRPTDHLDRIEAPQLVFAGTRDRLGPPEMIEKVAARIPDADVIIVDDGDHSFKVPKRAETTTKEVLATIAGQTAAWIAERI